MKILYCLAMSITILYGQPLTSDTSSGHAVQSVQIFYHFGRFDELDTFHGVCQKDLVGGIAKTPLWLTTVEQECILNKVMEIGFFSFPDTLYRQTNMVVSPDLGPQKLRIKYKNQDKTVVWYASSDARNKILRDIRSLQRLLNSIVMSKPEYQALPPAKGAYL